MEINLIQKMDHLLLRQTTRRTNRSMTCIHNVRLELDNESEQTFIFNGSKVGTGLLGPFIKLNLNKRYCVYLYWLKQRI